MTINPNHLTIGRIISVPVIALLICMKTEITTVLALVIFLLAAASDWYDGYLARQTGKTSLFGAVFDATADKLLIIGCLLALAYTDKLEMGLIFPALAIIMREIFIAGLREFVANDAIAQKGDTEEKKASRLLASSDLAKIKTAVQMAAIAVLIPASPSGFMHPYLGMLGGLFLWIAAGIGLFTGWQYWRIVRLVPVMRSHE